MKKKKQKHFSARKIIPPCGQTDSSQGGIHAHISGSAIFFPWLATLSFAPDHPER